MNTLLDDAESRIAAADAAGAVAALEQAEGAGLDGMEQISRAGYLWLNLGHYDAAERRFDEAVLATGAAGHFYYQCLAGRGAARFRTNRRDEGMADLVAAKALDPDQPLAYLLLGLALSDAGDKSAAVTELRDGVSRAPADARFTRALAVVAPNSP